MTEDNSDLKGVTVSSDTLRPDHLVVAFGEKLVELGENLEEWEDIMEWCAISASHPVMSDIPEDKQYDQLHDCVEEFESLLNSYAPDGYMFGNHDGDGACFGFWPSDWDGNP